MTPCCIEMTVVNAPIAKATATHGITNRRSMIRVLFGRLTITTISGPCPYDDCPRCTSESREGEAGNVGRSGKTTTGGSPDPLVAVGCGALPP